MQQTELVTFIDTNIKGTTTGSFVVDTPVRLKANNPFGEVRQKQTLNGIIGFDYNNSVNRMADKEGKQERDAQPRAWGTISPNRIWVLHTPKGTTQEKRYLQIKVERQLNNDATRPVLYEVATGKTLTQADIEPYRYAKSKTSTQADLVGEVVVRDIKVDNICEAHIMGQTIVME